MPPTDKTDADNKPRVRGAHSAVLAGKTAGGMITVRIKDLSLHHKLMLLCARERTSCNALAVALLTQFVADYEQRHGPLPLPTPEPEPESEKQDLRPAAETETITSTPEEVRDDN